MKDVEEGEVEEVEVKNKIVDVGEEEGEGEEK